MSESRIAFYSPGMVGLGHLRRNLLIAQSLARSTPAPAILLVAEAREAGTLHMPAGVDCVTLPALQKAPDGGCAPRHLAQSLARTVDLRSRTIAAALGAFDPDLLIVDHLPWGAQGELRRALEFLRLRARTRCVLGLRDVLDAPEAVREEWRTRDYDRALRSYYEAIWVYGDREVFDLVSEYALPSPVARMVRFTGYLDTRARLDCDPEASEHLVTSLGLPDGPLAVCMVGGGIDGGPIARTFLESPLPTGASGIALTGPYMPAEARRALYALAARRRDMRVVDLLAEPAFLLRRANWLITMGGYNSLCDVLSFGTPALVVPRNNGRAEQRIRAERFAHRGLLEVVDPGAVSPAILGAWMRRVSGSPARTPRPVDLGGLTRIPGLVREVVGDVADPADVTTLRAG